MAENKLKLDPRATGTASAVITFALSLICLIIVLISQNFALNFFGMFFHGIDISQISTASTNIISGIIGSIILAVIAFIAGWLSAVIYNRALVR